jgi:hypothetical protein
MQMLIVNGTVDVSRDLFSAEELADLAVALGGATIPETIRVTAPPGVTLSESFFSPLSGYDVDGNAARDFDEDNDRALDVLDDGLAGPVHPGNILCGSGIPGDVLQIAAQHELDPEQRALLASAFPDGFPPRSPVFCGSTTFLLGLTGESAPGRRDFLWHGAAEDTDEDGITDFLDVCPTIADPDQADQDGDGVGDLCDNCVNVANPRVASPPPAPFTTTGGQRDDDVDGIGNACDAQVVSLGPVVTSADFNEFKVSVGRRRDAAVCGTSRALACARFDLDGLGAAISAVDFNRAKVSVGRAPGPTCAACGDFLQLACEGPACPAP